MAAMALLLPMYTAATRTNRPRGGLKLAASPMKGFRGHRARDVIVVQEKEHAPHRSGRAGLRGRHCRDEECRRRPYREGLTPEETLSAVTSGLTVRDTEAVLSGVGVVWSCRSA